MSPARSSRLKARSIILPRALLCMVRTWGRRRLQDPARILVAHNLLLGDTLMLTPLLAKLAARFPKASVVMTVSPPMTALYQGKPYGVNAIPYDPRDVTCGSPLLQVPGFDLALVPGDNRYSWLAAAAGSRWTVASGGDRPAYKNWPVDEIRSYSAEPRAWGDMMADLIDGPEPPPYRVSDWPAPPARAFPLPGGPYCALHVGASSVLKMWPSSKWRTLAEALGKHGLEVVWSGGPGEDKLVRDIDPEGRFRSYAGLLDLPQMWHLLRGASLLVSPDTGIAHMGRIVGAPTVTLFGPGSATLCATGAFWRDVPYRAVTIEDFHCRDQRVLFKRKIDWVRRCGRTPSECERPRCMEAIAVEQVLLRCEELLGNRS